MILDKPYWISKEGELIHFETIPLTYLNNIIKLMKRTLENPEEHPTYEFAVKVYDYRDSISATAIIKKRTIIGYWKEDKTFALKKHIDKFDRYDGVINNNIELINLLNTKIPVGSLN